jgi:hypothetical protein
MFVLGRRNRLLKFRDLEGNHFVADENQIPRIDPKRLGEPGVAAERFAEA